MFIFAITIIHDTSNVLLQNTFIMLEQNVKLQLKRAIQLVACQW